MTFASTRFCVASHLEWPVGWGEKTGHDPAVSLVKTGLRGLLEHGILPQVPWLHVIMGARWA